MKTFFLLHIFSHTPSFDYLLLFVYAPVTLLGNYDDKSIEKVFKDKEEIPIATERTAAQILLTILDEQNRNGNVDGAEAARENWSLLTKQGCNKWISQETKIKLGLRLWECKPVNSTNIKTREEYSDKNGHQESAIYKNLLRNTIKSIIEDNEKKDEGRKFLKMFVDNEGRNFLPNSLESPFDLTSVCNMLNRFNDELNTNKMINLRGKQEQEQEQEVAGAPSSSKMSKLQSKKRNNKDTRANKKSSSEASPSKRRRPSSPNVKSKKKGSKTSSSAAGGTLFQGVFDLEKLDETKSVYRSLGITFDDALKGNWLMDSITKEAKRKLKDIWNEST